MKKHFFILGFFLSFFLQSAWTQTTAQTERIDALNRKAFDMVEEKPDSAVLLAKEVLAESDLISYPKGKALALTRLAIVSRNQGRLDSAIHFFEKSLEIRKASGLSKSGIAGIYTRIGNTYKDKNLYARAIIYLTDALKIRKEIGVNQWIYEAHIDLGIAYKNLALRKQSVFNLDSAKRDFQESIFHYQESMDRSKLENPKRYADASMMISSVYRALGEYDQAISAINEAEKINLAQLENSSASDSTKYLRELADIYTRKGLIYSESGKVHEATDYHLKAIELNQIAFDSLNSFIAFINMGDNAIDREDFQAALANFKKAEKLKSAANSDKRQLLNLYDNLILAYEALGKNSEANFYLKERTQLNTVIYLETNKAQLEDDNEMYKLESTVQEKLLENKYQKRLSLGILIGGVLISALLSMILYNSYQKQKYQAIIIENQEANHMQHLLSQLEEAEQQILADQSAKQQMLLTSIGKELHDSIGSMLSAAKRELENLRNNLVEIPNKAESQFEHSYGMIDKAIRDLRKISKSPDKLSLEEQLIPSLRELCKNINRIENSPNIELNTYRLEGVKLPAKHELHIFRIIQEAITNIIKHAQATDIQLQLDWADRILSITVEDNGKGFDPKKIQHGVGLDSMRSRTEELNGTFTLDTAPGRGSTLFMEISIPG